MIFKKNEKGKARTNRQEINDYNFADRCFWMKKFRYVGQMTDMVDKL